MLASTLPIRLAGLGPRVYARLHVPIAAPAAQLRIAVTGQRNYATPGRPKGAVGEPTKTVKRAVKRVAADKTDTPDAPKAKAKSTTPKKVAKPKKAAKPKPKPKPKAKAKKAAPKFEDLTPEQQEKETRRIKNAELKARRAEVASLKQQALLLPKGITSSPRLFTAWLVYNTEKSKGAINAEDGTVPERSKRNAIAWKQLSPAEHEHYNHVANEANAENVRVYKEWLEQYTPDQIRLANIARKRLRSRLEEPRRRYSPLPDERLVKRNANHYGLFVKERMLSGDFKNIGVSGGAPALIAKEWAALTAGEKQKYFDLAQEGYDVYAKEFLEVYGYPPPSRQPPRGQAES